jgi:uncharacterized protein YggE
MKAHLLSDIATWSETLTMGKNILLKALLVLLVFSVEARAQRLEEGEMDARTPTIQVSGTGVVHAEPDMAAITIGVTTDEPDVETALSKNTAATAKVLLELQAASIDKKDLKTSNFSIYPQYPPSRDGSAASPRPLSYRVSNSVTVTVRDIGKLGEILAKAVGAGSNQISGPRFLVSEPEKYLDQARKKAIENAMAKASVYAAAAGLKLGPVLVISEQPISAPVYPASVRSLAPGAPVPIEAGEQALQAQINLLIELQR